METSGIKKAGDVLGEILDEREYECEKHGKYTGRPIFLKWMNREMNPSCPLCDEEAAEHQAIEEERLAEEQRRKADAAAEQKRIAWLTELNIGKRLWNETFETFDAYTDELRHHLEVCADFARNPQGRKLVMLGKNGTGKNHLAASVLKVTGGVVRKAYEVMLMLHQSYSGDTKEYDVILALCETEMLVIDEIGRTKGGQWEENWLSYVIDKRHEDLLPMILISNKHLKEDCPTGGCPDCLQNWVGNDILSRIIEDGLIMEFTGEDYRMKKRYQ